MWFNRGKGRKVFGPIRVRVGDRVVLAFQKMIAHSQEVIPLLAIAADHFLRGKVTVRRSAVSMEVPLEELTRSIKRQVIHLSFPVY